MKKMMIGVFTITSLFLIAGCTKNSAQLDSGNQTETTAVTESTSNSTSQSSTSASSQATDGITYMEAIATFQKEFPGVDITSVEVNSKADAGTDSYEIEGMDDNKEYKMIIDAKSGSISFSTSEQLDDDERNGVERNEEKINLSGLLSLDEIQTIALKEAGGGTVVESSLEREWNSTYWEITVRTNTQEISVSIDAKSGNVLEKEIDD